jgi:hypothetical protein
MIIGLFFGIICVFLIQRVFNDEILVIAISIVVSYLVIYFIIHN